MKKLILFMGFALMMGCEGFKKKEDAKLNRIVDFKYGEEIELNLPRVYYSTGYIYELTLEADGDTIHERFVSSNHTIRFLPGDTVYKWYGNWLIWKNS